MTDTNRAPDADGSFPTEVERLKIANIFLEQGNDFKEQLRAHEKSVDSQINRGLSILTIAGFVAICIGSIGIYKALETGVQDRIDKEFGTKEISTLIRDSASTAAKKLIQKQIEENQAAEHHQLKCANEKNSREIFALRCQLNGGSFDELSTTCTSKSGEESYYDPVFPKLDCKELQKTNNLTKGSAPDHK